MTLSQATNVSMDNHGKRFPAITIRADGVHDVGRLINTLVRGNCEQAELAHDIAHQLRQTEEGRYTLQYLVGHGGYDFPEREVDDWCIQCPDPNEGGGECSECGEVIPDES